MATKKQNNKITKENVKKVTKAVADVVENKVEKVMDTVEDVVTDIVENKVPETVEEAKEVVKKAKKAIKTTLFVEYYGKQVAEKEMIAAVKKAWTKSGNKVSDIKSIELYAKPEDGAVYYVINKTESGKVEF